MWRPKSFYFRQLLKLLGMIVSSVAIGNILFVKGKLGALGTAVTVVTVFAAMIIVDSIIAIVIRNIQKNKILREKILREKILEDIAQQHRQKSQTIEKIQIEQQNYISQLHQKIELVEHVVANIERNLVMKQKNNLQQDNNQTKFTNEIENVMSQINTHEYNENNQQDIVDEKHYNQNLFQNLSQNLSYDYPSLQDNNSKYNQTIAKDIYNAVTQQKIEIALQSIIAAKYQKISGYQAFTYIKDKGQSQIPQREIQRIVREINLNTKMDLQSIEQILCIAAEISDPHSPLPIIYSPSIEIFSNAQECKKLIRILEIYNNVATTLCLQWKQQDYQFSNPVIKDALQAVANYGVRYALTDIVNLDIDFASLARQNFKIISINANDLLYNTHRMGAQFHPEDYHDLMRRNDIMMVTHQVNEPEMIVHLLEKNVHFVQGDAVSEARTYHNLSIMTG